MAESKRSKSTTTRKAAKPAPKPVPVAPEEPVVSYADLHEARLEMEDAQVAVTRALRSLNRARADQSDFARRDANVAAALDELNARRSDAAAATFRFETLRRKAGSRT